MDFRGEYVTKWVGSGSNVDPGLAMQEEDETGLFLFNPGTSSGLSVTKRGVEQVRFSDGLTTFFEPVSFSGGTSSTFTGQVYLSDGNGSAPSLAFNTDNKTGVYKRASGTIGVSSVGTNVMDINTSKMDLFVPLVMNGNSISCSTISASSGSLSTPSLSIGSSSSGFSFNTTSQLLSASIGGASAAQLSGSTLTVGALSTTNVTASGNLQTTAGNVVISNDSGPPQPSLLWNKSATFAGFNFATSSSLLQACVGSGTVATFGTSGSIFGSVTTGALSSTSITNSGTMSCTGFTPSSVTCSGTMSSTGFTASGSMSCGTNAMSCGQLNSYMKINTPSTPFTISNGTSNIINYLLDQGSAASLTMPAFIQGGVFEFIVLGALTHTWTISSASATTFSCITFVGTGGSAGTNGSNVTNLILGTTSSLGDRIIVRGSGSHWWAQAYLASGTSLTFS